MANLKRYNDGLIRLDLWIRRLLAIGDAELLNTAVCDGARDLVSADAASFITIDSLNEALSFKAVSGGSGYPEVGALALRKCHLCASAAGCGTPVRVDSVPVKCLVSCGFLRDSGVTRALVVPVVESGSVTGCLAAFRKGEPFDLVDEQLLQQFAHSVSPVLGHVELLAELENHAAELEREVSDRVRAEERLEQANNLLESIMEGVETPIVVIGLDHRLIMVNSAARRYYQKDPLLADRQLCYEALYGRSTPCSSSEGCTCPLDEVRSTGRTAFIPQEHLLCDGEQRFAETMSSPLRDKTGSLVGVIKSLRDITEHKRAEERIRQMAYYDPLTGLPNRHLFTERLNQTLALAQRNDRHIAVLFLDLDRFKNINDTLGHSTGDQLLQAVAHRLQDCCKRDGDTVARQGGDEFIISLTDVSHVQDAVKIAQKIIDSFREPFMLSGRELFIGTSIGISVYPFDGKESESLVKNADFAMYRAKEQGRNSCQLYSPSMNSKAVERLSMENNLRRALERGELLLHYQPKVNVIEGQIVCMEALVRWQSPILGLVPPARFIPLAEDTGLIVPLGEWVLRTACAQNKAWQDAGYPPMQVAVNLSARQFNQGDLVETVSRALSDTGLSPCWLVLEVTESVMMDNVESTICMLQALSTMGVQISVDDFGTGYSSLNYLKKFPINTLKIDQSFIRDITSNPDDEAIATAVINMAHGLNLKVVAEGVETVQQLELLKSLKCTEMQGYFFGQPSPVEQFSQLLCNVHYAIGGSY